MLLQTIITHSVITLFMALSLTAAITDVHSFRIPNSISVAIAGLFPVHVLAQAYSTGAGVGTEWLYSLAIAAIILVVGLVMFALKYVGGGDVKFLAAAALWAGPSWIFDMLLLTSLVGGVMALLMISSLRQTLAYVCNYCRLSAVSETLMANALPYGVAISAGALYVGVRLLAV